MRENTFEFDLENGEISRDTWGHYAIRYYPSEAGMMVEVGDGYRHNIILEGKYWNKILRIIRDNELDEEGIKAIIRGLMSRGLSEEYEEKFITAIWSGIIKEVKDKNE